MKRTVFIFVLGIVLLSFTSRTDFLAGQKKFERVRTTIADKQDFLEKKLKESQISLDNLNLLITAYKDDDLLEVYAKTKQGAIYKKILSYKICSRSGQLGPKREQGDGQVPEGFYYIDRFNPASNFYLSLRLNYPNLSDKRKSKASKLGGDIFIHGSCVTIGCIPMTDDFIKEIYLLAVHAKNNGQEKIPVYIFPFDMSDRNFQTYERKYKDNTALISFWRNLKTGHDQFKKDLLELKVKVTEKGDYAF